MVSCPYPQYLCGQFSRFGVGSKNAAFFLGDNVSVESKSKNSKSIHSVSFQRVRTYFITTLHLILTRNLPFSTLQFLSYKYASFSIYNSSSS
jgi:hypothetical protein